MEASEKSQRAQFTVVVHIALIENEMLVLLRRANTGFMDGYYGLPGGHLEKGETVLQAVVRECREETGLLPEALELLAVLSYPSDGSRGLNFVFTERLAGRQPVLCEPENFDRCGLYPLVDLPLPTIGWVADLGEALLRPGVRPLFREYP